MILTKEMKENLADAKTDDALSALLRRIQQTL